MGTLVFQATLGGQVNLTGPNTASTFTISVPAVTGTMITSGDTATVTSTMISGPITTAKGGTGLTSFTANGIVYASSTSALATGSALTFDGANAFNMGASNAGGYNTVGINNPSSTGYARMLFSIGASGATGQGGVGYAPGIFFKIGTDTDSSSTPMTFILNGSEQMRLTSTGLGIGTSSPLSKLSVQSSASSTVSVRTTDAVFGSVTGGTALDCLNTSYAALTPFGIRGSTLTFGTSAGISATLDASGNLGLGVTPSAWIGINAVQVGNLGALSSSTSAGTVLSNNAYATSAGWAAKYITTGTASFYEQIGGAHYWLQAPSGTAGNAITFTQAMTLDASGNLLVGTTTNSNSTRQVIGWTSASQFGLTLDDSYSGAAGATAIYFRRNGSNIGSITTTTTTTAYNITSDHRLKENIQDAEDAAILIDAIQVRQYDWKSDGSHQRYGFVAQELVTVAPEAVHQPADPDDMMAVDYSKLVPMLVKEIQSLRKRLAAAGI